MDPTLVLPCSVRLVVAYEATVALLRVHCSVIAHWDVTEHQILDKDTLKSPVPHLPQSAVESLVVVQIAKCRLAHLFSDQGQRDLPDCLIGIDIAEANHDISHRFRPIIVVTVRINLWNATLIMLVMLKFNRGPLCDRKNKTSSTDR